MELFQGKGSCACLDDVHGGILRYGTGASCRLALPDVGSIDPLGDGLLLQLWEMAGEAGPLTVQLPEGTDSGSIQPVDLRGRPNGSRRAFDSGQFSIELSAFAPASVVIDKKP